MSTRSNWLGLVLVTGMALLPAAVVGQEPQYSPPDPQIPLPLYSNRPDEGGLYAAGEFVFWRQTNPLSHELIATRGFFDPDGSIKANLGLGNTPGFLGSNRPALYADDAGGPGSYQPGFHAVLGWRFRDGISVEASWIHLVTAKYTHTATGAPPGFAVGAFDEETFLFAPVFNWTPDYAGPPNKFRIPIIQRIPNPTPPPNFFTVVVPVDFGNIGIWNGASTMEVLFTQRFDRYELTGRVPVWEDDCFRTYGLLGPRIDWIWERFLWRTADFAVDGTGGPIDAANYTNVVSNRMYGIHGGCGNEYRCGDTPIGTFSVSLDLQAALMIDAVKEEAKYERDDRFTSQKRSRRDYTVAPELQGTLNFWWYPIEGVQVRVGYDINMFFNTIASPNPVDFDFGSVAPPFVSKFRIMDGFNAGIAFIF